MSKSVVKKLKQRNTVFCIKTLVNSDNNNGHLKISYDSVDKRMY